MLAFTNGILQKNKKTKTNPDWSDLCRFPNISVLVQGEYHRCSRDIYSFGLMVQAFTGLKLCESVCVSRVCDSCRCPCPSCSALQPTHWAGSCYNKVIGCCLYSFPWKYCDKSGLFILQIHQSYLVLVLACTLASPLYCEDYSNTET